MTDQDQGQLADAGPSTTPDQEPVDAGGPAGHDPGLEPDAPTTGTETATDETADAAAGDGADQDAAGIEPGETQSVPTVRGPGPDGDPIQGQEPGQG